MTAVHGWLMIVGLALAVGPLILHMLLQDKPKRLPFPALRFVMQKQQHARRSFRLRHWILLALRMGIVALVALALSRPAAATALFGSSLLLAATLLSAVGFAFLTWFWRNKLRSDDEAPTGGNRSADLSRTAAGGASTALGRYWPLGLLILILFGHLVTASLLSYQLWAGSGGPVLTGKQPVAAAIVVDTSPRMQYRADNQTRLERAQAMARSIVERLPAGSQISIIDTSPDPVGLSLDLAAAKQQIDSLGISYLTQSLPNRIRAAVRLLTDSPLEARELFLLTDLTRPGWGDPAEQRRGLELDPNIATYVLDVGIKSYENWSIDDWVLPTPSLTPGGTFQCRATIARKATLPSDEDLVRETAADYAERATDRTNREMVDGAVGPADPSNPGDARPELPTATNDFGLGAAAETPMGEPAGGMMARDLPAESRTVRVLIEKPEKGRPVYRNGETLVPTQYWERLTQVTLAPGQSMEVAFSIPDLPEGVHQGWLEVVGGDALGFDNRRYFTVSVQPAWRILLVNGPGVSDANFLEAIAPLGIREKGQANYDCQVVAGGEWNELNLNDYRVVFFLDPGPLQDSEWERLQRYVTQGGSVGMFLGHNALNAADQGSTPDPSFNAERAQTLLPGRLEAPWRRPDGTLFFDPQAWDHPIFSRIQPLRTQLEWYRLSVFMHHAIDVQESGRQAVGDATVPSAAAEGPAMDSEPMAGTILDSAPTSADSPSSDVQSRSDELSAEAAPARAVRVLATYSNNQPALIETLYGQGQFLTMTTPVTDPTRPDDGRRPWNAFSVGGDWSFPYFLLANEIALHLATAQSPPLNGLVGDSFVLPNDQPNAPEQYALFRPENQEPLDVAVEKGRVYVDFTRTPGAYRLRGVNRESVELVRGFSVNANAVQSELNRIGKPQLDGWLGLGRYLVAETEEQIQRAQGAGRLGLEFYPSLVRILAVVFIAELLFSNVFYREAPKKRTAHDIVVGSSIPEGGA